MTRARLSLIAGIVMIVAACVLPCWTFVALSAASLPYQDPTPEMLAEQAAEVSALERALVLDLSIAAVLALLGVLACVYGFRRQRHRPSAGPDLSTAGDQTADSA